MKPEFPPRTWRDVAEYNDEDIVSRYREYRHHDPPPGDNRPPGYRWGWANAKRDLSSGEDGFDGLRSDYIKAMGGVTALLAVRH